DPERRAFREHGGAGAADDPRLLGAVGGRKLDGRVVAQASGRGVSLAEFLARILSRSRHGAGRSGRNRIGAGRADRGFIGGVLGRAADSWLVSSLSPARQVGPRLEGLKLQSSAEGAPMACVFGRARVVGQVIWAARFLERKEKRSGGKGGQKTVDYAYSLSFAVALCEGPIDGIGRVWADGQPMDMAGVTMRLHRG